jgi:tetratricopeptide (TPR) repeat protein
VEPNKTSLDSVLKHRTVVPRWKSPQQAVETYSIDKAKSLRRKKRSDVWIKRLTSSYEQLPTPHGANELYETALLAGSVDDLPPTVVKQSGQLRDAIALQSARYSSYGAAPERATLTLGDTLNVHEDSARSEIRRLRKLLAANPDRSFCWSELARHFLVVGEKEKAIRSMQAALQVARRNRYLCRAAARLFVHVEDPDRALSLLRSEPDIKQDPWLLAAEIAISSITAKSSRLLDAGARIMESSQFDNRQLSELASALGTVELDHGGAKRAKALFHRSLVAPTENALAQAQWALERNTKIVIPEAAWSTPASYEAKALASRQAHKWADALHWCAAWLADEPFSSRPALMGSYLGSVQPEHYALAEKFATVGLGSSNANISLWNNRAVARAYQGKTVEAYEDIKAALQHSPARDDTHLLATLGLIAMRSGMAEVGREQYRQSIAWLSQAKDYAGVASAVLNLMREELRLDGYANPRWLRVVQQLAKSPVVIREPELIGMTRVILKEVGVGSQIVNVANASPVLSPASSDEFKYQASLFHVPDKAKHLVPNLGDYSALV